MIPRNQELTTGDGATVYQAGGNINNYGLSYPEVRQIALDVYYANAPQLRELAKEVANARAEHITTEYLAQLTAKNPSALGNLADPDVQSVMFEAQKSYARSGDEDLETVLIDLLVDRTVQIDRSLKTLVLNEAIASAPKLTASQRRSIALVFLLRYTRTTSNTVDDFMKTYVDEIVAIGGEIPQLRQDVLHIEYVGAGSSSLAEYPFANGLINGSGGLFTRGFPHEIIPEALKNSPHFNTIFVPSLREPTNFQIAGICADDIVEMTEKLGITELQEELKSLAKNGRMQGHEVMAEAAAHNPGIQDVAKSWDLLKGLTLTSVGLAIGHSYWKRVTGADEDLGTWLL